MVDVGFEGVDGTGLSEPVCDTLESAERQRVLEVSTSLAEGRHASDNVTFVSIEHIHATRVFDARRQGHIPSVRLEWSVQ